MGLAFNLFILMSHLRTFSDDQNLLSAIEGCLGYEYFQNLLGVVEIARGMPCAVSSTVDDGRYLRAIDSGGCRTRRSFGQTLSFFFSRP